MRKNSILELWRFIAALLIMACHMHHFGIHNYYFFETWIYVEFFLIITGYFTAKHFEHEKEKDQQGSRMYMKNALDHTVAKFKPLMINVLLANIFAYLIQMTQVIKSGDINGIWGCFENMVCDVLLISTSYQAPLVVPLWYMSAMILVFPLVCVIAQNKDHHLVIEMCFLFPVLFYSIYGPTGDHYGIISLLRVLAGMMLGVLACRSNSFLDDVLDKIGHLRLTCLEYLFLSIAMLSSCLHRSVQRLNIILFFGGSFILLSGRSYSKDVSNRIFDYLGRLSVFIYIWHWNIGTVINKLVDKGWIDLSRRCIFIYYIATILVAVIMDHIMRSIRIKRLIDVS